MAKPIDHVGALSAEIGPRGTATHGEQQGANYARQVLRNLGYQVDEQEFVAPTTFSWTFILIYLLPTIALLIGLINLWAGALVALLGAAVFFLELNTVEVVSRFMPNGKSRNVVARTPGVTGKRSLVLVAHVDSSKAAMNFSPQMVKGFRTSFLIMVYSVILSTVLLVAAALLQLKWLSWVAIPFIGYLLVNVGFMLHRENWNRYTDGANDNASGVGVALTLAEKMRGKLPSSNLWCLITGAEEAGTFGMIRFLAKYGAELKDALFINLDNIGAGTVHFMSGEGMFPTFNSTSELLDACQEVQQDNPDLGVKQGVYNLMSTDALPALVRGYKAISLLAVDEQGLLPNWHWLSDTYENVDEKTLAQAEVFVAKLLEVLDKRA